MLKATEIEQLIKQNEPLPPKADYFEKFYYHALSVAVDLYRQKKINRDKLKKYQLEYKRIYEQLLMWLEILQKHRKLEMLLGNAELCGCECCKKISKLLDGRENVE